MSSFRGALNVAIFDNTDVLLEALQHVEKKGAHLPEVAIPKVTQITHLAGIDGVVRLLVVFDCFVTGWLE